MLFYKLCMLSFYFVISWKVILKVVAKWLLCFSCIVHVHLSVQLLQLVPCYIASADEKLFEYINSVGNRRHILCCWLLCYWVWRERKWCKN